EPVLTVQLGWVTVPTIGAAGAAFTVSVATWEGVELQVPETIALYWFPFIAAVTLVSVRVGVVMPMLTKPLPELTCHCKPPVVFIENDAFAPSHTVVLAGWVLIVTASAF